MEAPEVGLAAPEDAPGIAALYDAAQAPGGLGLSERIPAARIAGFLAAMPGVVARRDGRVVGAVLAQGVPALAEASPMVAAMLAAYAPGPGAYVYGPVAVAAEERGKGLAGRLARRLAAELPGREGVLFIAEANAPSLRAHERLGARTVGAFETPGGRYLVLALRDAGAAP